MSDTLYLISFKTEEGIVGVEPRCHCGKFVKRGYIELNGLGEVRPKEWVCKTHGEIRPHYEWIGDLMALTKH